MDYKNAKIYKITDIAYTKMYIGSTCQPLSKRFSNHKALFKLWKDGKKGKVTSYDLFDEFGIENCKIELIENFACNCKDELQKKEGEHIRNNDCVNKYIPCQTQKEYREANKDNIKDNKKKYYIDNKDNINEKQKKYREANKEKIKNNKKKYYIDNKDNINEKQKEYNAKKKAAMAEI